MGVIKKITYSFIYRLRGYIGVDRFNKTGGQDVPADGGSGLKRETTKEIEMYEGMQELLAQGISWMKHEGINRVVCLDGKIRMENKRNHNKERRDEVRKG